MSTFYCYVECRIFSGGWGGLPVTYRGVRFAWESPPFKLPATEATHFTSFFFLTCCRSKSAVQQVTAVASAQVAEQEAAVAAAAVPDWVYDPNEPRYCLCNQVSQMREDVFIPSRRHRRNLTPA